MTVGSITSKKQFDELCTSGKVIFVDFYANWCGPCKAISPEFENLASKHAREGVEFYNVNIDNVEDLAVELGIRSIPTFHAYKNGAQLDPPVVGANKTALTNFVQKHVA
ncbi:putative thioredoxin [Boletus coccyginus]|nr:putative thioredoxin [Boletus coccyginus]